MQINNNRTLQLLFYPEHSPIAHSGQHLDTDLNPSYLPSQTVQNWGSAQLSNSDTNSDRFHK